MIMKALARQIDARIETAATGPGSDVTSVHSADTMSGLIANASPETLLVTSLNNPQLILVAELMDAPGLCLVGAVEPSPELVAQALVPREALAAAEAGELSDLRLLSLWFCEQGCSGSPLVLPDPFLAELGRQRCAQLLRGAPAGAAGAVPRSRPYAQRTGLRLNTDMTAAIRALGRIDKLARTLPGRDCGACGAPTCALFAEDDVMGRVESSACPHGKGIQEVSQ